MLEDDGVDAEDAVMRLGVLREEAAKLPLSTGSAEFNSWKPRVPSVLTWALAADLDVVSLKAARHEGEELFIRHGLTCGGG